MANHKRQDNKGLMTSLTDTRMKFARKNGWYIPKIHDTYLRMEVED